MAFTNFKQISDVQKAYQSRYELKSGLLQLLIYISRSRHPGQLIGRLNGVKIRSL